MSRRTSLAKPSYLIDSDSESEDEHVRLKPSHSFKAKGKSRTVQSDDSDDVFEIQDASDDLDSDSDSLAGDPEVIEIDDSDHDLDTPSFSGSHDDNGTTSGSGPETPQPIAKEFEGYFHGTGPFVDLSSIPPHKEPEAKGKPSLVQSVLSTFSNTSKSRQVTLDSMFSSMKRTSQKASREDIDFIVSDDDEDRRSAKKRKVATSPSSSRAIPEGGSSGRGWLSAFAKNRKFIKFDFVPSADQVERHRKEADEKNKRMMYPPIHDLADIFRDMIDRAPGVEELAKTLADRPLRVATMCSGTESPLLALELMARAMKDKFGIRIKIEHVFSCEIEPFKQAYIERNFSPPILFRDVTELGGDQAHTAYGALVDVPGNVDLLVAGTSCVDYSHLNNKKKGLNDGGESGRTFRGMLQWVQKHKPALVILENVKNAPWVGVAETIVAEAGYDVGFSNLFDTKNYYIPHTRQRGYLFASRNTKDCLPENWSLLTGWMVRPASSPLDAFLLPSDDPRIQRVRMQFSHGEGLSKGRSTIDWSKCQSRHERARDEEDLGKTRPYTAWEEGGTCKLSHDGWNEWALRQPERVTDLMDITTLRFAALRQDPIYKSKIWELSQNVDRNVAASKPGIAPCLTPSGMPFLTSRGGPLIGLEALSLQGLPLDELLLTREKDDQLQDLAGNAMSSTVVGACVLSALLAGRRDLEKSNVPRSKPSANEMVKASSDVVEAVAAEGDIILGLGDLEDDDLDLTSSVKVSMPELLQAAVRSSQLCNCEGRTVVTDKPIFRCASCDHTACQGCKGRPIHEFELDQRSRDAPDSFAQVLKKALPMRLSTSGITLEALTRAASGSRFDDATLFRRWSERVAEAAGNAEFKFQDLLRQKVWQARFAAPGAKLDLYLDPIKPHWRLSVEPLPSEPAGSSLRALLLHPVGRMALDPLASNTDLLHGSWEVCLPTRETVDVTVTSKGKPVPTWEAGMGLGGMFVGNMRYSEIEIDVPSNALSRLDSDIRGTYDLKEQCGTSNGALHCRRGDENTASSRKLYLFIDADRFKDQDADRFVFSTDIGRLPYPLERVTVAKLAPGWKPKQAQADKDMVVERVPMSISGTWKAVDSISVHPSSRANGKISVPRKAISIDLESTDCSSALAVMSCTAPVQARQLGRIWPAGGAWGQVDLLHKTATTFHELAWLVEKVPEITAFKEWMTAKHRHLDLASATCDRCAPAEPDIQWLSVPGKAIVPIENSAQAGPYEQALKNRPCPFVMQLRLNEGVAEIRFGLNAATLMHRALSRLPPTNQSGEVELSWRLTRADRSLDMFSLPKYIIKSNRADPEAPSPKIFALELRKEQRRSLTWMLEQERDDIEPFWEEEISEGLLTPLGWRAEGKASRPVFVRGGVLADAVGYGKTAISLALIAASPRRLIEPSPPAGEEEALIPTKATLIIVPGHLCKQWQKEVGKFCGRKLSVLVVTSKSDLNKLSINQILQVDIIIMSVTVYKSDTYWETLSRAAGANPLPIKAGRFFNAALTKSLAALKKRVKELRDPAQGPKTMLSSIRKRVDFDDSHITSHKARGRLVGKAYADAHSKDGEDMWLDGGDEPVAVEDRNSSRDTGPDVWSLGSSGTQKDWRRMTCPPLEMFMWNRVVVDEFHYIAESADRTLAGITSLQARAKWILSGTPPTADFADVKSIAVFLNVHLGVDDDADTLKDSVRKAREKNRTAAEKFNNFREMHSPAWHHRRQEVAQKFLDSFVRSNEPEIGELPSQQLIKPILLPAAESALYLELAHAIENLDLRHQRKVFKGRPKVKAGKSGDGTNGKTKGKKLGDPQLDLSHRDQRLIDTLGNSASPEEALLKRASVYDDFAGVDMSQMMGVNNAIKACEYIVRERRKQLEDCKEQLERELPNAMEQHLLVLHHFGFRDENRQFFADFVRNAHNASWGDNESKRMIKDILAKANCNLAMISREAARRYFSEKGKLAAVLKRREKEIAAIAKDGDEDKKPAKVSDKEKAWTEEYHLRTMVHQLTRLRNELVGRVNALRFFTMIRDCQRAHLEGVKVEVVCPSPKCSHGGKPLKLEDISISSTCGHSGCRTCILRDAYIGVCPTEGCAALAKPTSVVNASSLGAEDDGHATKFGTKLAMLCSLLKTIPSNERALVFVQFETLTATVAAALEQYGVSFVQLTGSAKRRSDLLEAYQEDEGARVLLLNVDDESAAGSNLTVANHVIFVGPLLKQEQQQYDATMTQAIGRCVRYGQLKKVFVWRFIAVETIDQEVIEKREGIELDIASLDREFEAAIGGPLDLKDVKGMGESSTKRGVGNNSAAGGRKKGKTSSFIVDDDSD
ncbi:hypothetical protein IE53DRAFT_258648 [Violaceomyces palustris]|uniref:Uncharacterized protein n=1 Tax=Violaceomyces palustris TaxID=1673888 RepID=A0ACD0P8D2_9BASI|nr:hypothetical protein IE53DRAFT_258648 [Violaceomyces palustris]